MRTPLIQPHSLFRPPPIRRWGIALAAVLGILVIGVPVALAVTPPAYTLILDGRLVASGRGTAALEQALLDGARALAQRELLLTSGERSWSVRLADLGFTVDEDRLRTSFAAALADAPWWRRGLWGRVPLEVHVEPRWETSRLEAALAPVREAITVQPVDARLQIKDRQPVITPDTEGVSVETPVVVQALAALWKEDRIEVPLTRRLAAVTAGGLKGLGIRRLIAEWVTHYDPSIPRAENVEKAAATFNGLMLRPGEILSYNATVGPITAATGWKEAYVIVGGELVPGVGGGVCQVATTLYGAALRANLEIVERHPHQLVVNYVAPSQDAAIAQGWEDLKLRNTTGGHLLIETESGGGRVAFRLYGDLPQGLEIKIESRVLSSRPFTTRQIVDPQLAPGEQRIKLTGYPGLSSEAYRLVYQDGNLVTKELLSRDSYLPSTQVVLVGPAPPGRN